MRQRCKTYKVRGVKFSMIGVGGGEFALNQNVETVRGGGKSDLSEQIKLKDFHIAQTPVTQELWLAVMGDVPSYYRYEKNLPVDSVTKNDCLRFLRRLNRLTGEDFRLPTEAEWVYAATGGRRGRGSVYSGGNSPERIAWYEANSDQKTHPVARKKANELGLYDMSGNVSELCVRTDSMHQEAADANSETNSNNEDYVLKGGNFLSSDSEISVLSRENFDAKGSSDMYGIRLALSKTTD